MRTGRRIAAAGVAACFACVLMFAAAVSAPAGTPIESFRAAGEARGLDVAFTFQGSLFERLVDIGMPTAKSDLVSEGSGAARGVAAQLFPGDLVVSGAGEALPFYRQAVYPTTPTDPEPVDDAHTTGSRLPGTIAAGPLLAIENSHLRATASESEASGLVTTNQVSLGMGLPLITIKHLETTATSTRSVDRVVHVAQSIARDISIKVSETLSIEIGAVISEAKTSSDGVSPTAVSKLTVSGVTVLMSGTRYGATIDNDGIHLDGAEDPIPSAIPQNLSQVLSAGLTNAGLKVATAETAPTIEDVTGEATLGGLVITATGSVPFVYTPPILNELIYAEIVPRLPDSIRPYIENSICLQRDVVPRLPDPLRENFPIQDPLCFSRNAVPGPGSGVIATFAIGAVRSVSAAVQAQSFDDGSGGGGDGGFLPGLDVAPPPTEGGFGGQPPVVPPGQQGQPQQQRLFGLVARMPSEALLGTGAVFFLLAMALSFGPSLRRWRSPTS